MLKNLRHSLIITVFTFVFMWIIGNIPFLDNVEALNPIENILDDFDLTDIVYSKLREKPNADPNITMVNIGNLDREGVAMLLEEINKHKPKTVGIDAFFRSKKEDFPEGDDALAESCKNTTNLVLVTKLIYDSKKDKYTKVETSHPMFHKHATGGFANLTTSGKKNMDEFLTARTFMPQAKVKGETKLAFAVQLADVFDKEKTKQFLERNKGNEYINFRGNIGIEDGEDVVFAAVDYGQVFDKEFDPEVFKDKIVILGYMGDYLGVKSFDDKFYTPLNENYIGNRTPDMYGVVVHANIVSMILNEEYIDEMSFSFDLILEFLITFLSVWLFSYLFHKTGALYDAIAIPSQLIIFVIILYIGLKSFQWYRTRVEINIAIIAVILAGIFVELYFGLFLKLFDRFGSKKNKLNTTNNNEAS